MSLDGFFISHLVNELDQSLSKARLDKVSHASETSFLFQFHHRGQRHSLIIELEANRFGAWLTGQNKGDGTTSQLLLTLKKHLEGAILDRIGQHQTDRVMLFHFIRHDYIMGPLAKTLVFEAMGRHSNLLLVQDGNIVDCFKKMFFESGRQLLPQAAFAFFPTDKQPFTALDYDDVLEPDVLVRRYMGVSPVLARYLFQQRCKLEEIDVLPVKSLKSERFYCFNVFGDDPIKTYPSLSALLDDRKTHKPSSTVSHEHFINKQLDKLSRKQVVLEDEHEKALEMLKDKDKADAIYSSGLDVQTRTSSIALAGETLSLDPTKTLNENAQELYRRYRKAKRGLTRLEKMMKETAWLLEWFEHQKTYLALSGETGLADLEKDLMTYGYNPKRRTQGRKQPAKPDILKIEHHGATFLVGRNNIQNTYVTQTLAQRHDVWFHVKDAPGSHVVVQAAALSEAIIRMAAMLAAYFSKLRHSSSIPVDYTEVRHVKKIAGRPGYHVTYRQHKTIFIDIDETLLNDWLENKRI
ncbi:MAG: fibronectin-binding domain-containing protein [Acholeplasmataceae bacterium]|nr:MAG: fibronectin-binding domain-containing protein [Acholeplasmataceae bacterium]